MQNRLGTRWFRTHLALVLSLTVWLTLFGLNTSSRLNANADAFQFASVADSHPRLFFSETELGELRRQAAETHKEIWEDILVGVSEDLSIVTAVPANADLNFFRQQGNRLFPLAFACVISGRSDICNATKQQAIAHAGWENWDVAETRDLGLAHMLVGNALAYDWLYDEFTPEELELVRTSLARQGAKMYAASTVAGQVSSWANWWRRSYAQNHYAINHSALGVTALALLNDVTPTTCYLTSSGETANLRRTPGTNYPPAGQLRRGESVEAVALQDGAEGHNWWWLANDLWVRADVVTAAASCPNPSPDVSRWLDHAQAQLSLLSDLLETIGDGTWHEGIPYQNYLLTFTLPFIAGLRDVTGVDLSPRDYLAAFVDWRLHNWLPTGQFILSFGNFDWSWANGYSPRALLRFAAAETGDGRAEWLAQQLDRVASSEDYIWRVFEFFYYDPQIEAVPPQGEALSYVSQDLESVIWRTGWEADDLVIGLRSGVLGGRYNSSAFVHQNAPPWQPPCLELGCQLNIDHDHDDAGSLTVYRSGSWLVPEVVGWGYSDAAYHNTLLIDGQGQYRPPEEHFGTRPEDFAERDTILKLTEHSSSLDYAIIDLTGRYRHIPGVQRVERHVVFAHPDYIIIHDSIQGDRQHNYEWITHFEASVQVEDNWLHGEAHDNQVVGLAAFSRLPLTLSTGANGLPFGRIQLNAESAQLTSFLFPTDAGRWHARPAVQTAHADQGILLQIVLPDSIDEILINTTESGQAVTLGSYRTDARVVRIHREYTGVVRDLVVIDGSFVEDLASTEPLELFPKRLS